MICLYSHFVIEKFRKFSSSGYKVPCLYILLVSSLEDVPVNPEFTDQLLIFRSSSKTGSIGVKTASCTNAYDILVYVFEFEIGYEIETTYW